MKHLHAILVPPEEVCRINPCLYDPIGIDLERDQGRISVLHEFGKSRASILGQEFMIVKQKRERHAITGGGAACLIQLMGDEPVVVKTLGVGPQHGDHVLESKLARVIE